MKKNIDKQLLKKICSFVLLSSLLFMFTASVSNAQLSIIKTSDAGYKQGDYTINDFVTLGVRVAEFIWAISGSLALLAFVYGVLSIWVRK